MHFALFGAGRVGWVHAQNIANHPDAKLSHVYDVDGSASRRMVAALGGKVAETPEEIWSAEGVDAVLVTSSTNTQSLEPIILQAWYHSLPSVLCSASRNTGEISGARRPTGC